jgi:hypothetical protein
MISPGAPVPSERIILALDQPNVASALALVEAIPDLRWVKVGLELFIAAGPQVVRQLREELGKRVFLDLKLHDIPATMAGACRSAASPRGGLGRRGKGEPPATNPSCRHRAHELGGPAISSGTRHRRACADLRQATGRASGRGWDRRLRLLTAGGGSLAGRSPGALHAGYPRHPPSGHDARGSSQGDESSPGPGRWRQPVSGRTTDQCSNRSS